MSKSVVYVGLDVHKDSIAIAVACEGRRPAEEWKTIPYDGVRLRKALKMLAPDGQALKVCYEAGPTGFGLCRRLRKAGIDCIVVAPSLVPGKPGDRVKTDRRDAKRLAHFLRSGDLTEVSRARRSRRSRPRSGVRLRRRQMPRCAARHQLSKFLLRHDRPLAGKAWTQKHLDWIRTQKFSYPAQQRVFADYLKAVEDLAERVASLTSALEELVQETVLARLVKGFKRFAASASSTRSPLRRRSAAT